MSRRQTVEAFVRSVTEQRNAYGGRVERLELSSVRVGGAPMPMTEIRRGKRFAEVKQWDNIRFEAEVVRDGDYLKLMRPTGVEVLA